jgi:hypothetical protein
LLFSERKGDADEAMGGLTLKKRHAYMPDETDKRHAYVG